jgi:hypothetical protein
MAAFPMSEVGRLRIGNFGACSMFTCITAYVLAESPTVTLLHQRASPNRVSFLDCSDCYWLERKLPGGLRTHWKTTPFHGALRQAPRCAIARPRAATVDPPKAGVVLTPCDIARRRHCEYRVVLCSRLHLGQKCPILPQ